MTAHTHIYKNDFSSSEVQNLTKVANHCIAAGEQYQYGHLGSQPRYPGKNRSPICKTLGNLTSGVRTIHYQEKRYFQRKIITRRTW